MELCICTAQKICLGLKVFGSHIKTKKAIFISLLKAGDFTKALGPQMQR